MAKGWCILGLFFLFVSAEQSLYAQADSAMVAPPVVEEFLESDAYYEEFVESDNSSQSIIEFEGFMYMEGVRELKTLTRHIDDAAFADMKNQNGYIYYKELPAESEYVVPQSSGLWDWLEKFLVWLFTFLESDLGKLLLWIAVALITLFLLSRFLFKVKLSQLSQSTKLGGNLADAAESEEQYPEDIAQSIREAETSGDWRTAVSLLFKDLVVRMKEQGMISNSPGVPNFEILQSLRATDYHHSFKQLLHHYEYIYYGHYDIGSAKYYEVKNIYESIKAKL